MARQVVSADNNLTCRTSPLHRAFWPHFQSACFFVIIVDMDSKINYHTKKMVQLYYQDRIWELADNGLSVRQITDLINKKYLPRSKFKGVQLSKSTVHNIMKKKRKKNE